MYSIQLYRIHVNQIFLMKTFFYLFSLSVVVCLLNACKTEPKEIVIVERIQGNWKVIDAFRNKRQTKLLNNAIVEITDTSFMTNIPPEQGPQKYTYNLNKIMLLDDNETTYLVNSIRGDTMTLTTQIQNFNFDLVLAKNDESDKK